MLQRDKYYLLIAVLPLHQLASSVMDYIGAREDSSGVKNGKLPNEYIFKKKMHSL